MQYLKYFKPKQKILLRPFGPTLPPRRFEVLTAYFQGHGPSYFDLALPYRTPEGEHYPFTPGMPFEILSDAMGLGIRLTGRFREMRGTDLLRVEINDDLEVFQRRSQQRVETSTGLQFTRGQGKLRSFRDQWQRNIHILETKPDLSQLPSFPDCRVNLSSSGIRFSIKTPAEAADLCLLLLDLHDRCPPVCALAEVVWTGDADEEGRRPTGMQFINILESDQERIESFVRRNAQQGTGEGNRGSLPI
ncbi:MAG: hypothetical protein C0617_14915 [Desulfuromonas sp.]|uniref:PilZ domain-containing protein n=1 Tax=Desulfuromonas sp. TaxID=892 RepID=UPI000CC2F8A2|nr:PilZ domain-containing protein [Desulfuromonas sp.]PLX82398.1 MAG: hypothetical protein C0617_14915 [Desulfuromonas sp.]